MSRQKPYSDLLTEFEHDLGACAGEVNRCAVAVTQLQRELAALAEHRIAELDQKLEEASRQQAHLAQLVGDLMRRLEDWRPR